jgi:uncharacterized membrane protein YbhN (UPF0104 family)
VQPSLTVLKAVILGMCPRAIGIPSAVAVSTAIAVRLVTFYLPPIWGSVSMRWLRRHEYV